MKARWGKLKADIREQLFSNLIDYRDQIDMVFWKKNSLDFRQFCVLSPLVDELVCLQQPSPFYAVGAHFEEFTQVSDQQVARWLADFDARRAAPPTRLEVTP